jgi:hypothetical protein
VDVLGSEARIVPWHGWDLVPGGFPTSPVGPNSTAVSWGPNRIDIVGDVSGDPCIHAAYS